MCINSMLRWCIYTPPWMFPLLMLHQRSIISGFSTLISANALDKSKQTKQAPLRRNSRQRWKLLQTKMRSRTENNNAVCKFDFSGKLSYSSAKQTDRRVSAEDQEWLTTDKRLWLGAEWAPQWGDWADCWGGGGWQACQGPILGWFMLIRAAGSCGCFLWSVK